MSEIGTSVSSPTTTTMTFTQPEPLLGYATTEQLLEELIARFTTTLSYAGVGRAIALARIEGSLAKVELEYRTVNEVG
jgi:hypothetical protein